MILCICLHKSQGQRRPRPGNHGIQGLVPGRTRYLSEKSPLKKMSSESEEKIFNLCLCSTHFDLTDEQLLA